MTIKNIKPQVTEYVIYRDPELLEEDMPEADAHLSLILYLVPLLRWLYRDKNCYIGGNLLIIQPLVGGERQIAPDVAVFKNLTEPLNEGRLNSWRMSEPNRPAPVVTFEVASEKTWHDDLGKKISDYAELGVHEYFAYDPNTPPYWGINGRLRGWRYIKGQAEVLVPNKQGWLWSEELESWLVSDGRLLHLYDRQEQLRLTQAEEEHQARLEERQARLQAERQIQAERQARQAERVALQAEQRARLEAERVAKQELEQKLQEALEKLRQLGQNLEL